MNPRVSLYQLVIKAKSVIRTTTLRQSAITFVGTAINGLLGALFFIISGRFLGPQDFGLMSVAVVFTTLLASIGDLGTNTGIVRFAAKYADSDPEKALQYLKLAFKIRVIVALIIAIFGLTLSEPLVLLVFSKPELLIPIRIAVFGVIGSLLFSFITSVLQTYQRFWGWSFIFIFTNGLRIIIVLALIFLSKISMVSFLVSYVSVLYIGFLVGTFMIPTKFLKVKGEVALGKNFMDYNVWVFGFTIIASIGSRLDTFISARLLTEFQLGLYLAANQIVQIVPQIVAAIGTIVAPKISSMKNIKELKSYLEKTQLLVLGIALLGVLTIPLSAYVLPLLFGEAYAGSVTVFVILLFAMLTLLISVPVHNAVFYFFSYPKLFFWLSIVHFLIILIIGWNLTSLYGTVGAASGVLIGQVFNFVIPAFWVLRKIKVQK